MGTIKEVLRWAENRSEPGNEDTDANLGTDETEKEDRQFSELESLILESQNARGEVQMTKRLVLQIPTVKGCIGFISNMICMLPIRLYEKNDGDVSEIREDRRVSLLNNDTNDTLDPVQWKRAWIEDYFLGSGGFTYIQRNPYPQFFAGKPDYGSDFIGLYYVDESRVAIHKNTDAIFKDFNVMVDGKTYYPWDFLIILRDTRDGCHNISLVQENDLIFRVAYQSLRYENDLVSKGGNKKGFIKSPKKLSKTAVDALKAAFRKLYRNNSENVVILNGGLEFQESSNTSVEMQMNENKESNAKELCKLFNILPGVLNGSGSEQDFKDSFTMACMPVMKAIETALNKALLFEEEKKRRYFCFDTTEMLKGSMKERYSAYVEALNGGFLSIDEVREKENLNPIGFGYINIGLNSVLFNPVTHEVYNTNSNTKADMDDLKGGELVDESGNQSGRDAHIGIRERTGQDEPSGEHTEGESGGSD